MYDPQIRSAYEQDKKEIEVRQSSKEESGGEESRQEQEQVDEDGDGGA